MSTESESPVLDLLAEMTAIKTTDEVGDTRAPAFLPHACIAAISAPTPMMFITRVRL